MRRQYKSKDPITGTRNADQRVRSQVGIRPRAPANRTSQAYPHVRYVGRPRRLAVAGACTRLGPRSRRREGLPRQTLQLEFTQTLVKRHLDGQAFAPEPRLVSRGLGPL